MTVNLKLFHLGNHVVRIAKKIESEVPSGVLKDSLMEILGIVNEIRLAVQHENDPKESWKIEFACTTQELLAIREQMEVLELSYELRPKDQK